jgi:hypothetical protein
MPPSNASRPRRACAQNKSYADLDGRTSDDSDDDAMSDSDASVASEASEASEGSENSEGSEGSEASEASEGAGREEESGEESGEESDDDEWDYEDDANEATRALIKEVYASQSCVAAAPRVDDRRAGRARGRG